MEYLAEAVDTAIATYCVSDYAEEWDLEGLANEVRTFWPSQITAEDLADAEGTDALYERLMAEAVAHYEGRESEVGADTMRKLEREVMLRIIDQKWREHLADMDYLREGINLRAMGQKDPLNEWQREGYEFFGSMMSSIAQDFVRYLMHIQVTVREPEQREEPALRDVQTSGPEDPVQGSAAMRNGGAPIGPDGVAPQPKPEEEPANVPVTKSDWDKTGRNEPCPCGSGKKYKLCHGR
jgi:preprotein translocase subunit SecA